jgi:hypothetical protein
VIYLTIRKAKYKMWYMSVIGTIGTDLPVEDDFTSGLVEVLSPLRAALGRMLAEWGSPKTASELQRLSGVGWTICWQVFRIVNAGEVTAEARHAPTPSSLKRLLVAAGLAGVSEQTVRAVRASAESFQAFSKHAAGDRAAFASMLGGVSSEETGDKILKSQRRTVYRGMSHIAGVQVDLHYFSSIIHRSASGNGHAAVNLTAQIGMRRLRPDSKIAVFGRHINPSSTPGAIQHEDAIDPEAAAQYDMPVLPQFCTSPLPKVERTEMPSGWVYYNALGNDIGLRSSFNLTFGRFVRETPFTSEADGRRVHSSTIHHIHKPAAMAIQELLVHRPSFPNARPELMIYQYREGDLSLEAARRSQQYPVDERLAMVGRANAVELADVPRYSELLRVGANAAGWDLSEFDVYRLRMPYPIMFSAIRIFFYVD